MLQGVAGSMHRISLDLEVQRVADVVAGVVVVDDVQKSVLHGMGWPDSWINNALEQCDDARAALATLSRDRESCDALRALYVEP